MATAVYIFKLRRDESADWTTRNPILRDGEPGFEKDTLRLKIGDGLTPWNSLPYLPSSTGDEDGPSLVLLYENAKV